MSGIDAHTRSKRYSAIKTGIFVADLALSLAALAGFQVLLSRPVSALAFGIYQNFYAACFIYASLFLVFMYAVSFPLKISGSFFVERAFHLSRQTFSAWLRDELKSTALSFALYMSCIQVFYLVLRNFPSTWWLITSGGWIFFTVVMARFLPVLLIPLFFKYSPIQEVGLKERIMALAERSGIRVMDVCQIDFSRKTAKANAALVGLGGTRKVILADTLLQKFGTEEVESVVAHEFGHFKYRHIWQLLFFSAAMTLLGFFALYRASGMIVYLTGSGGLSDLYIFPMLILLAAIFGLAVLPFQNLFSRVLERQSDRFAIEITGSPSAFIAVMKKLASVNLADTEPSAVKKIFLYDHPPIGERIRMGEEYEKRIKVKG
jgi:STE24 endopeptidase